jgi:squalene-hopene/tetraprenyl-beta-curcumene cyclase
VPALPFELAAFPQRWFKWLRLPVVSYALPALIAIGQVRHTLRPSRSIAVRTVRSLARGRTLRLLGRIQPTSGGFLEATPLTSFVVMSLAAAGAADDPVVRRGVEFLARSARPDGSWPIDTNLATWVTTLSINALAHNPDFHHVLPADERAKLRDWLLGQQYRTEHPYTLADPGGWAWTDLPGGVPDADDTSGTLLALRHLGDVDVRTRDAAAAGTRWLLDLQNADGGIPTFCRGWGKLPFDRSSPDLTAHTLRAWSAWSGDLPPALSRRVAAAAKAARLYLHSAQRQQGHWAPLWFGNQHADGEENPTYGTSRVLLARTWTGSAAVWWLIGRQNADGGWGGAEATPSSIEETALAIEALADAWGGGQGATLELFGPLQTSIERGLVWLIERTDRGRCFVPSPVGFYFAKLWYWEQLYPLIWTVGALEQVAAARGRHSDKTADKADVLLCETVPLAEPK